MMVRFIQVKRTRKVDDDDVSNAQITADNWNASISNLKARSLRWRYYLGDVCRTKNMSHISESAELSKLAGTSTQRVATISVSDCASYL